MRSHQFKTTFFKKNQIKNIEKSLVTSQSKKKKHKTDATAECVDERDEKLFKIEVKSSEYMNVGSGKTKSQSDAISSKHLKPKDAATKKSKKPVRVDESDASIKTSTTLSVKSNKKKLDSDYTNVSADCGDVSTLSAFVNKLKPGTTAEMLKDFVESHGFEVVSSRKIVRSSFGFVQFTSEAELHRAIGSLSGQVFQDSPIVVAVAKSKESLSITQDTPKQKKLLSKRELKQKADRENKTLFVKNIGQSATKEILSKEFPEAIKIIIPKKKDGSIKGYALVLYSSESLKNAALIKSQGIVVEGRKLFLDSSHSRSQDTVQVKKQKDKTVKKTLDKKTLDKKTLDKNLSNKLKNQSVNKKKKERMMKRQTEKKRDVQKRTQ